MEAVNVRRRPRAVGSCCILTNDYAGLNKARRLHESLVAASVDVAVMLSRVDPAADRAERIHETNGPE